MLLTAAASGPVFSTQPAISGVVDSKTFTVFLPLFNTGSGVAGNVVVTSVALGSSAPESPALPLAVGTLAPSAHQVLDLRFKSGGLTPGHKYLLTVRGTYQTGGKGPVLGFAVSQFVVPSTPDSAVLTQLRHWMVLDAVKNKANTLRGVDRAADNQTLLDFLNSLGEFIDSGIDAASSSVWATFANGEQIGFVNDRPAGHAPASRAPASFSQPSAPSSASPFELAVELPASSSVRLLNTLTGPQFQAETLMANLAAMLEPQHYSVNSLVPTVEDLKTIGGEGVFYYSAHGGFVGDGGPTSPLRYGVWTGTQADILADTLFPGDVGNGLTGLTTLIHILAANDVSNGKPVEEWHYSITARFVRKYFKNFSDNSFVYIDACRSDDPRLGTDSAQDFKQAFFDKHASVYAGWTEEPYDNDAIDNARLVFDRLLGANIFFPETLATPTGHVFKQRPFSWPYLVYPSATLTSGDLAQHHLGASGKAVLEFTPNPDAVKLNHNVFGLLAPSLANILVVEKGSFLGQNPSELLLGGNNILGSKAGSVTLGGAPLEVSHWASSGFPALLPHSGVGNGDSGDVVVTVDNHFSNPARVTLWPGTFNYLARGRDSLTLKATFAIAFRADIREVRETIHLPPIEPNIGGASMAMDPGSTTSFSCTGESTIYPPETTDASVTYKWRGSGMAALFNPGNPPPPPPPFFAVNGLSQSHTSLMLQLDVQANGQCTQDEHFVFPNPPGGSGDASNPMPFAFPNLPQLFLSLSDPGAVIEAGAVSYPGLRCETGPSPGLCPASVKWSSITPVAGTAPDPDSPR
jgi:hypothetical protein